MGLGERIAASLADRVEPVVSASGSSSRNASSVQATPAGRYSMPTGAKRAGAWRGRTARCGRRTRRRRAGRSSSAAISAKRGAEATSSSVIPCTAVASAGIGREGRTSRASGASRPVPVEAHDGERDDLVDPGIVRSSRSRTPRTPRARAPRPADETVPDCWPNWTRLHDVHRTGRCSYEVRDARGSRPRSAGTEAASRSRSANLLDRRLAKLDGGKGSCSGSSRFAQSRSLHPMSPTILMASAAGASSARRCKLSYSPDLASPAIASTAAVDLFSLSSLRRLGCDSSTSVSFVARTYRTRSRSMTSSGNVPRHATTPCTQTASPDWLSISSLRRTAERRVAAPPTRSLPARRGEQQQQQPREVL